MPEGNPNKSVIVERLRERLHKQGKNALILLVGETGESKSLSSITLANEIDPTFFEEIREKNSTLSRIAHQKGSEFSRLLKESNLRRGNAIIWDDVGKGLKRREWFDVFNRAIVDVLQTFRVLGLCVIFTCPDPRFIDSNALALVHYWGEMQSIDFKRELGKMKFFEIQINRRTGKTYYHYPRARVEGKVKTITRFYCKRPPKDIERLYEKDKRPVVKKLLDITAKMFKKIEERERIEALSDGEILDVILQDTEQYLKTYNKRTYVDPYAIMSKFKVGLPRATKLKGMAERALFKSS